MAYQPAAYAKTPLPTEAERRVISRFGGGYTPQTLRRLRAAGSPQAWLTKQLNPQQVSENSLVASIDTWFTDLLQTPPVTKWERQVAGKKFAYDYARELGCWTILRRIYSQRTVFETMVDFWSAHLHVPAQHGSAWACRSNYDAVIRKGALGKFDDLLVAATLHPAMLLHLDASLSVKGSPNENHGRELLELHTVGLNSGYTETMVRSSAVILSGWTVDCPTSFNAYYDPERHTMEAVRVLSFSDANVAPDGRKLVERYLRFLANHPSTAERIVTKLVRRFVSDEPLPALVSRLSDVFLRSGTDIKATLLALAQSPEFQIGPGRLVRTLPEDVVATTRALAVQASALTSPDSFASAISWYYSGDPVYMWPRPDGPPVGNAAVCTPDRMLNSLNMHWKLAGGWWPGRDVRYATPGSWLPQSSLRFDQLVDHLSRVWLGRRSTAALLETCCGATGLSPATRIDRNHALVRWGFHRLACCYLDSPAHMSR